MLFENVENSYIYTVNKLPWKKWNNHVNSYKKCHDFTDIKNCGIWLLRIIFWGTGWTELEWKNLRALVIVRGFQTHMGCG